MSTGHFRRCGCVVPAAVWPRVEGGNSRGRVTVGRGINVNEFVVGGEQTSKTRYTALFSIYSWLVRDGCAANLFDQRKRLR